MTLMLVVSAYLSGSHTSFQPIEIKMRSESNEYASLIVAHESLGFLR
jgi:hypothetical protein